MILVDANLLIYAKLADVPEHPRAHDWLDGQLNSGPRVGLPWESLTAFLRIVTNPRILPKPLTGAEAWAQVEAWLALPTVWTPEPVSTHASLLGRLIREVGATAKRIPDAHLAALALGHGLTLCSADADFRIFPRLKVLNPLQG